MMVFPLARRRCRMKPLPRSNHLPPFLDFLQLPQFPVVHPAGIGDFPFLLGDVREQVCVFLNQREGTLWAFRRWLRGRRRERCRPWCEI